MKKLCDAVQHRKKESSKPEIDYGKVHFALGQRVEELEKYIEQLQHLQHLCQKIDPKIVGKKK